MGKSALAGWMLCVLARVACAAEPVTLSDAGKTLTLANGLLFVQIDKGTGMVENLRYKDRSLLMAPAYLDWVSTDEDSERATRRQKGIYAVVTAPAATGGELADVSFHYTEGGKNPAFEVELHHVLRRGEPGLYSYALFSHPASYGAATIAQSRMVYRVAPELFDTVAVDATRTFACPPPDTAVKPLGPKESLLVMEGPFKGKIFDKYLDFVDAGDHFVHGWMGSKSHLGCWVVDGSTEDHNGGPTKQHNTAHFGQVLLKILTCGHYGAAPVELTKGQEWQKLYGPWMLYVNEGATKDALWADANARAAAQRAAWPYAWLKHPLYPQAQDRGTVMGRLEVRDPQDARASSANAWVGLAEPSPDWQQQSTNYQYWVHADAAGNFSIPNVRAASYTLYAFTNGVMDEFRRDQVVVKKGETTALEALEWTPIRHGRQLWQIGTPDRTAKEFRHGDDYREYGLPAKYPAEFPNDVLFTIGKSSERTDWNYAQPNVEREGKWVGPTWTVLFDMAAAGKGRATLDLAIAAANNASVTVAVNGKAVGATPMLPHDNAMIREGIHGQYALVKIPFDGALLKTGENKVTLTLHAGTGNLKNVMYDAVRLELAE
jgi:rhamnogalacturonan endolyase